MNKKEIVVGSRGSRLALVQTELVVQQLTDKYPNFDFHIRQIKTAGDRDHSSSLAQIGGQGIFVKELEQALLAGEIDMAVHSLKDMPVEVNPGLRLAAVLLRNEPRDAFISHSDKTLSELPDGAHVGTGSERRASQLKAFRPGIDITPLRGNVDTRLGKVASGELDGIIVAAAAMLRMGQEDRITEYLTIEHFLPSPGQGALAVEIRGPDHDMAQMISSINDRNAWDSVHAERSFLSHLGGGCRAPIAALGTVSGDKLHLEGMVASSDGSVILRASEDAPAANPDSAGRLLADKILSLGAGDIISGN